MKDSIDVRSPELSPDLVKSKWAEGAPLLRRWEFPLDLKAAALALAQIKDIIPEANDAFRKAHAALTGAFDRHPEQEQAIWRSFMEHEWEPWEEWINTEELDVASLLFLGSELPSPVPGVGCRGFAEKISAAPYLAQGLLSDLRVPACAAFFAG